MIPNNQISLRSRGSPAASAGNLSPPPLLREKSRQSYLGWLKMVWLRTSGVIGSQRRVFRMPLAPVCELGSRLRPEPSEPAHPEQRRCDLKLVAAAMTARIL